MGYIKCCKTITIQLHCPMWMKPSRKRCLPVQDTSLYVPLWLGSTDELATLLTLDILTPWFVNCSSPYANEALWRLRFASCKFACRFASTGARSWCSTNLASDATRPPSCLGQRVNQFKLDRSCHVSRSVRKQSRDYYVICLSLWLDMS